MSTYNDGESQLRNIPQSTPSLKDELTALIDTGWETDEDLAKAILDLVVSKVLDLPEMQLDLALGYSSMAAEKTASTHYWKCKGKDELRTQLTSAIKGLKG